MSLKLKNQLNISWKTAIILQAETLHTAAFKDAVESSSFSVIYSSKTEGAAYAVIAIVTG